MGCGPAARKLSSAFNKGSSGGVFPGREADSGKNRGPGGWITQSNRKLFCNATGLAFCVECD